MSALAQKVYKSIDELERLSEQGAIPEEILQKLLTAIDRSRNGRAFGHQSAIELPLNILQTVLACSELITQNEDDPAAISEVFKKNFEGRNARRPTTINTALRNVRQQIRKKPVPVSDFGKIDRSFVSRIKAIFGW